MQVWNGQYSSSQPAAASASNLVNCRAFYCLTPGSITYQQGPIGAPGAAQTIPMVAGQLAPIELNQGLITALGGGTYELLS